MPQWSSRINHVIFAVLYVSSILGVNSDKMSNVFRINICCFLNILFLFVTVVV